MIWENDLAVDSPQSWYLPLDKSRISFSSFRLTAVGRFITKNMVRVNEYDGHSINLETHFLMVHVDGEY